MKKTRYCAIAVLLIIGGFCTACESKEDTLKKATYDKNIEINDEKGAEALKETFGDNLKDKMIKGVEASRKFKELREGNISGEEITFKAEEVKIGSYTQGKEFPYTILYKGVDQYKSDKYDEDFFKTKALIVVGLRETSGSVRHEVKKVTKEDNKINVQIERIVPEIGTADMAEWEIYIEVNKADIDDINEVNLIM